MVYPEIVKTMVLYAAPQWRGLATSSDEEGFRAFHAEFTRRLPIDTPLRTTAKPWFLHQLRVIAHAIEDAPQRTAPRRPSLLK
ncbi:hypothetical protein [Streptomyces ipomoeae]|uniref:hypothetical protein n=1 Tax=Streptomyces ipomoeae TaxID=103232 RepID=UPI001F4259AB|nr:hypothetical protein [Streptomyces ipomoeae]